MTLNKLFAVAVATIMLLGCGEGSSESSSPQNSLDTDLTTKASEGIADLVTMAPDDATPVNTICPVMNEKVKDGGGKVSFGGKVIGFCCKDCIEEFKADPAKFAAAAK